MNLTHALPQTQALLRPHLRAPVRAPCPRTPYSTHSSLTDHYALHASRRCSPPLSPSYGDSSDAALQQARTQGLYQGPPAPTASGHADHFALPASSCSSMQGGQHHQTHDRECCSPALPHSPYASQGRRYLGTHRRRTNWCQVDTKMGSHEPVQQQDGNHAHRLDAVLSQLSEICRFKRLCGDQNTLLPGRVRLYQQLERVPYGTLRARWRSHLFVGDRVWAGRKSVWGSLAPLVAVSRVKSAFSPPKASRSTHSSQATRQGRSPWRSSTRGGSTAIPSTPVKL